MYQRVLVCGGRNYADRERVYSILDTAHAANPIILLIHGGASGADRLGADWAISRHVSCGEYPANWDRDGKAAGPIRNQLMLEDTKPHLVISFPGGRGTADMVRRAKNAGVPVVTVRKRP